MPKKNLQQLNLSTEFARRLEKARTPFAPIQSRQEEFRQRLEEIRLGQLEKKYPGGFIYRTGKGEFQFSPTGVDDENITSGPMLGMWRPPKRAFIPKEKPQFRID